MRAELGLIRADLTEIENLVRTVGDVVDAAIAADNPRVYIDEAVGLLGAPPSLSVVAERLEALVDP